MGMVVHLSPVEPLGTKLLFFACVGRVEQNFFVYSHRLHPCIVRYVFVIIND
jgi:hypothetical protein